MDHECEKRSGIRASPSAQADHRLERSGGNEFYLPDVRASREHAEIRWDGEAFVLTDLKISGGTYQPRDAAASTRHAALVATERAHNRFMSCSVENTSRDV